MLDSGEFPNVKIVVIARQMLKRLQETKSHERFKISTTQASHNSIATAHATDQASRNSIATAQATDQASRNSIATAHATDYRLMICNDFSNTDALGMEDYLAVYLFVCCIVFNCWTCTMAHDSCGPCFLTFSLPSLTSVHVNRFTPAQ